MKNKLLTLAAALALLAVLGKFYAAPAIAQAVRAALIRDSDNGALQPVNFKLSVNQTSAAQFVDVDGPTVPAGKRLVVEDISVFGLTPTGTVLTGVWLVNKGGENFLLVNPESGERSVSTDGRTNLYGYNRPVKVYYDAGNVIQAQIYRDSLTPGVAVPSGDFLVNVFVHGYYVNVP